MGIPYPKEKVDWTETDTGWETQHDGKTVALVRGESEGFGGYGWTATVDGVLVTRTAPDGRVFPADGIDDSRARSWKLCVWQYILKDE